MLIRITPYIPYIAYTPYITALGHKKAIMEIHLENAGIQKDASLYGKQKRKTVHFNSIHM